MIQCGLFTLLVCFMPLATAMRTDVKQMEVAMEETEYGTLDKASLAAEIQEAETETKLLKKLYEEKERKVHLLKEMFANASAQDRDLEASQKTLRREGAQSAFAP